MISARILIIFSFRTIYHFLFIIFFFDKHAVRPTIPLYLNSNLCSHFDFLFFIIFLFIYIIILYSFNLLFLFFCWGNFCLSIFDLNFFIMIFFLWLILNYSQLFLFWIRTSDHLNYAIVAYKLLFARWLFPLVIKRPSLLNFSLLFFFSFNNLCVKNHFNYLRVR